MFEQTFVNAQARSGNSWTVFGTLGLQTVLVAVLILIPLFHPEKLVTPLPGPVYFVLLHQPPVPPARPDAVAPTAHARSRVTVWRPPGFSHPVASISLAPDAPVLGDFSLAGPTAPFAMAGQGAFVMPLAPPSANPARAATVPTAAAPLRISMGAQAARLIYGPRPVYPTIAVATRVQGVVKLRALISRDGLITNLQLVSGPPLLVQTAMAAVQQWRYRPTLLGQEPVEVATEIEVRFTLSQ